MLHYVSCHAGRDKSPMAMIPYEAYPMNHNVAMKCNTSGLKAGENYVLDTTNEEKKRKNSAD